MYRRIYNANDLAANNVKIKYTQAELVSLVLPVVSGETN